MCALAFPFLAFSAHCSFSALQPPRRACLFLSKTLRWYVALKWPYTWIHIWEDSKQDTPRPFCLLLQLFIYCPFFAQTCEAIFIFLKKYHMGEPWHKRRTRTCQTMCCYDLPHGHCHEEGSELQSQLEHDKVPKYSCRLPLARVAKHMENVSWLMKKTIGAECSEGSGSRGWEKKHLFQSLQHALFVHFHIMECTSQSWGVCAPVYMHTIFSINEDGITNLAFGVMTLL